MGNFAVVLYPLYDSFELGIGVTKLRLGHVECNLRGKDNQDLPTLKFSFDIRTCAIAIFNLGYEFK